MMKRHFLIAGMALSLAGSVCATAYGQKKPKITKVKPTPAKKDDTTQSAEPDKVLYDRALLAVKHSKFIEARLDFQTLINTYPDSEYLAKAKLGVADSFYKEGGTSSLTQAIEEYKNFIVFFPFLDEAAYAQMQVGMAHYKLMEKEDRDNSHAEAAEDEFRTFLLKYPQSPFVPQAEQSMRDVQEVLAGGEFGIAQFYYVKKDYRASAARLVEVTARYPLFSQSDDALWMLGDVYQRAKLAVKNEDEKNHWADLASKCYDRIVSDYPSSNLVGGAKARLKEMNMPIPAPNPEAVQRMKQQQLYMKQHHELAVLKLPMGMIKGGPDVSVAAHSGAPNLNPPDDTVSAMEVLREGAAGPSFSVRSVGAETPIAGGAGTADSESVVTTDSPDAAAAAPAAAAPVADAPPAATAVPIVSPPNAGGSEVAAPATADPPAAAAPADAPATANSETGGESSSAASAGTAAVATTSATPQAQTASSQAAPAAGSSSSTTTTPAAAAKANPSTESTSKKKKGLHKLNPF